MISYLVPENQQDQEFPGLYDIPEPTTTRHLCDLRVLRAAA